MSNLVAIAFHDHSKAFDLRARLVELQKEYLISMDDIVVVTREQDDKIKLHQATNLTAAGAATGGFWGMLIGLVFLNPLLGLAVGAGAGALSGHFTDIGINDDATKNLGKELPLLAERRSVLVRSATNDKVLARLQDFAGEGKVLQTSLSTESEEELRNLIEKSKA